MRLTIAKRIHASFALFSDNTSRRVIHNYKWFLPIQSRWLDNDRYGHMNNAVYHGIFDSVINVYLIRHCGLDINSNNSSTVGFMVTNKCEFFGPAKYPDAYLVGLKVSKIGRTSLSYSAGLFPMKDPSHPLIANMTHGYFSGELEKLENVFEENASCVGESVHVFVDPTKGNKTKPIPIEWTEMIARIKN